MGFHSYGVMGVDWEERVRFDRLRDERLARIKENMLPYLDALAASVERLRSELYSTAAHKALSVPAALRA